MKKAFIYGAGYYGELVYKKIKNKYNIHGFIDSDTKKEGKFLKKKKIYSPDYLTKIDYDYIFIASMWSLEIKKFLVKKKIKNKKIVVFPISEIQNKIKKKKGWKKNLKNIVEIFKKNKIHYYLDHSSLLGFIRDKDIYKFGDIDIAVKFEQLDRILKLLKSSKKFSNIELGKMDIRQKIFGKNFIYQITVDGIIDLQIKKLSKSFRYWLSGSNILKISENFTKNLIDIDFKSMTLKIPKNHKVYLKKLYGEKWFKPAKNWTYEDFANISGQIKFKNNKSVKY
tara:strand:- start:1588 stop:2433 length:846 start_codon:yes stop_codon:yes gene_type:complete